MNATPPARHVIILGCSARKLATITPKAALDLYQGWCFPQLRAYVQGCPRLREDILVLSGLHGLIPADTRLLPYDQPLTPRRAAGLRHQVHQAWVQRSRRTAVGELLLLLEPAYLGLIGPSLLSHPPATAYWIPDPTRAWEHVATILYGWGWRPVPGVDVDDREPC